MSLSAQTAASLAALPKEQRADLANELTLARNILASDNKSSFRTTEARDQLNAIIALLRSAT